MPGLLVLVLATLCAGASGCKGERYLDRIYTPSSDEAGIMHADGGDRLDGALRRPDGAPPAGGGMTAHPDGARPMPTDDAGMPDPPMAEPCLRAAASERLPSRSAVTDGAMQPSARIMFTKDLFSLFRSHCGGCHVEAALGGFGVSLPTFANTIDGRAVERMRSDDPDRVMPPLSAGGKPASQRSEGDPVLELASLVERWIEAGRPADVFAVPAQGGAQAGDSPYRLEREVAGAMTNIGDCVPAKDLVASDQEAVRQMDAFFDRASELPLRLRDTDLVALDSATLARHGVVGYAPAYPLWSDNAKKIRAVRVPAGEPIRFDRVAQRFALPANTRFYKTFLREVVDRQGRKSYRKVETRVIVSRPDRKRPDGSYEVTSLFGTYAWNEPETEALLVRDPLRNGAPFRDRLVTIVTDEQQAQAVIESNPLNVQFALQDKGLTRTYAMPGSERCLHCHMGSPSHSFVLGFTPLQVHRRPLGEGGVVEPAGSDELNQLQRLIDYGISSEFDAADLKLLEDSQGARKPRNQLELEAQGYILGNCAHCHNPDGFASVKAPSLRDVLNLWPSPNGGIFEFPLESFSPRIKRGKQQRIPIPYITPSLFELEVFDGQNPTSFLSGIWVAKADIVFRDGRQVWNPVLAPWRSLVYRNVDAPFTYADHYAIFPHMPMDAPGLDCRAPRLLGSWMVSIPARRKHPQTDELHEAEPQPYVEVKPGSPGYDEAVQQASERLAQYRAGSRYNSCPDPALDIVDPRVVPGVPGSSTPATDSYRVPERAHWVVTDLTEVKAPWGPRRPDWRRILVDGDHQGLDPEDKDVVELLAEVVFTPELREFALSERPYGLWLEKDGCDLSSVPKAASFTGNERPLWFDVNEELRPDGSNPVYTQSPGGAVFNLICVNCHGPEADSQGRQADTIMTITGGATRVANLRDGIFGPPEAHGENRARVFGDVATPAISADTWAARYMIWMAIGGTEREIPRSILSLVSNTLVLGEGRAGGSAQVRDANMLQTAQWLCGQTLPDRARSFDMKAGRLRHGDKENGTSLIPSNGDAELWEELCSRDNPAPVRVLTVFSSDPTLWSRARNYRVCENCLRSPEAYPADAPVGDHSGNVVTGIAPSNRMPWCIRKPSKPELLEAAESFRQANRLQGKLPPFCPETLFAKVGAADVHLWSNADKVRWTRRGAMNAGLAVFAYLDAVAGGLKPKPAYNACEQLIP
ncbi:MAG: hypothetical protein MJD61_06425 [Proteobacteria bacterium]|nr:hypothetical protein [Pseudomonadota bacterium]